MENTASSENKITSYEHYRLKVPEFRVSEAKLKLQRLSDRAVKLGMPAFEIDLGEPEVVTRKVDGVNQHVRVIPISVWGGPPKIPGWRFIAKIDHDKAGNEVKGFAAQALIDKEPELFKTLTTCEPDCAHCQLKRDRKTTYLFENEKTPGANRILVGSSCVEDFTGHKDPGAVLAMASQFPEVIEQFSDPDDAFGGGGSFRVFSVKEIFTAAAAIIRLDGRWIPRDKATEYGASTDWVTQLMMDAKTYAKVVQDVDKRTAEAVYQWLSDDSFDPGTNLYLHNLKMAVVKEYVQPKMIGFTGSAVAAWGRNQPSSQSNQQAHQSYESIWLGKHDEKIERTVRVEKILTMENMYGISRLHIMRDLDTNAKVTWFNSGARKFFEGDTYQITGRVKNMGIRDGQRETQLTRVNSPDIALHNKIDAGMEEKAIIKKARKIKHLDARDGDGETLLHVASHLYRYRGEGKDLILDLVERGADPSLLSNRDDSNAFDYWLDSRDEELIKMGCEKFPQLAEPWDMTKFEKYGLEDEPWVSLVIAAREKALQNKAVEQKQVRASRDLNLAAESAKPLERGQSELDALRGGAIADGERLPREAFANSQTSIDDDDLDDDSTLKLA